MYCWRFKFSALSKLYYWVKCYVLKEHSALIFWVWEPYETAWPECEGAMILWNVQSYLSSDNVTSQKALIFRLIIKAITFSIFLKKHLWLLEITSWYLSVTTVIFLKCTNCEISLLSQCEMDCSRRKRTECCKMCNWITDWHTNNENCFRITC